MRIAQVAPLCESVPPTNYGGTERVVSYLTEELVRLGHEVTLFASGDSVTSAKLVPGCSRALWHEPNCREELPHHLRLMELVFADVSRFDLIHFHCDSVQFPLLRRVGCPSVSTLHGRLDLPDTKPLFEEFQEIPLVSISDSQRRPIPWANWQGTVLHGMPRNTHTFREKPGSYLAFLGRISPEKRLDRAIEIARLAGRKLKVAARIYKGERGYFEEQIEPLLQRHSSFVEFIGEVGGREKDEFLGNAEALLFPIDWPEPFGLMMIESLACGTPVIAWRCGSVPEVIEDGASGYIVDSIEEGVEAVHRLQWLDRRACRLAFESRFDVTRMTNDYLALYRRQIHSAPAHAMKNARTTVPTHGHALPHERTKTVRAHSRVLGAASSVPREIEPRGIEAV